MTKQIIAVDADDTIFDEQTAMMKFHNQTYGTNHRLADYLLSADYDSWEKVWGVDQKEADRRYEAFIEHKLQHNIPPIKNAREVLTELKQTYDLVIITARDKRGVTMTHDALNKHYPDLFSDVYFVPLWNGDTEVTKAQICNEIGASYLIDDNYEHCRIAAKAGVTGLLFGDFGWNVDIPTVQNIVKVKDWPAVLQFFLKTKTNA